MLEQVHFLDIVLRRLLVAYEPVPYVRAQLVPLAPGHQVPRRVLDLHQLTASQVPVWSLPADTCI